MEINWLGIDKDFSLVIGYLLREDCDCLLDSGKYELGYSLIHLERSLGFVSLFGCWNVVAWSVVTILE